jgi:BioD-like phosphotransacetylase family protein
MKPDSAQAPSELRPCRTARAEELGVPILVVHDFDTLTAVERMEALLGRAHLHDPAKAARVREMLEQEADLGPIFRAAGIE